MGRVESLNLAGQKSVWGLKMLERCLVDVDDPIYHSSFTGKYIDYNVSYNDGTRVQYIKAGWPIKSVDLES